MPEHRISPAEQMRRSLEQFLSGGLTSEGEPTSTLVRLAARVVLQEALEDEQREVVGRDRYERGGDGRYRNGYRPGHVDRAEGRIEVQVPQVRGVPGYSSKLLEFLGDNSEVLERLVTEMYARGRSTRDVEEAFTDARGECILGRSAVSALTDRLWEEYEAFCARDLSGFAVTYLFVEERRRTKVIPRFFTERSCLKLAFGALERASRRWQRVTITELEQRRLELLRKELEPEPPPGTKRTDTLAA